MHPAVILIVIIAVMLFISWRKRAPAAQKRKVTNRALIVGGLVLVFVLLVTGRLSPLIAGLAALVPIAYRVLGALQTINTLKGVSSAFRSSKGPNPGQNSQVSSRYLRMTLEHDTGDMHGEVLEGLHAGKALSDLGIEQLLELLARYQQQDSQSAALMEAYLDRTFGDSWRERDDSRQRNSQRDEYDTGSVSEQEAYEILGLEPGATREEIVDAHRRLMQKLHPDRGGSTFLAAKINEAKKRLLNR